MINLKNKQIKNLKINVASGVYVLEDYINYDFSVFFLLSYIPIPSFFFLIIKI